MKAADFVARLTASVDRYYENGDYEAFHERQIRIWGEIVGAGREVEEAVAAVLRERLHKGEK